MKATLLAAAALACILGLSAPAQEAKKGNPCDTAAVEEGFWCSKCKKIREKEQVDADKCKECQTAVDKIKVCVKKWIPSCGMHQQTPHLESCCKSKMCCKLQTIKSPVVFRCEGCGQSAREEKDVKHDAKTHEQKLVKSCEASGTQPHGGEPIKQP